MFPGPLREIAFVISGELHVATNDVRSIQGLLNEPGEQLLDSRMLNTVPLSVVVILAGSSKQQRDESRNVPLWVAASALRLPQLPRIFV